ncbi:NADP-dependent oxidoreductase [Microbacterium sp. LWH7-1.2]|jgi:NADPH:quinone reductase-like Zn-dependent oxidoreductase|uniref:NADP-dependent oxidoreductase n=1 Tax=Microbacterium sp. LWH7-1.2 TaxID=3135257 RepID=UPI0031391609
MADEMLAYALAAVDTEPGFLEVPTPQVDKGEVLVRVTAASVNPHDGQVATGEAARYMQYRYPVVLGSDFAGVVEAVGREVDDLAVGDRVFGLVRERIAARGSLAPLLATPREHLAPTPTTITDQQAGVLGLAAITALHCVDATGALTRGDLVLVNGATGGVGTYVVQLLAAQGVAVIATARPSAADYIREAGATHAVDWTAGDLKGAVSALAPHGVAAIIDVITSTPEVLTALSHRLLGPGGRVVSTRHAVDQARVKAGTGVNVLSEASADVLDRVAQLADAHVLRAPITASVPFARVAEAFQFLDRGVIGKVAVQMPG